MFALAKLISGGQTGVDRAALDVALELGLPCGGWCPRGRRAEDGPLPAKYPLQEMASSEYPPRTAQNVRDSDGTLILTHGRPDRGTLLTRTLAEHYGKPCLVVDLMKDGGDAATVRAWIAANGIQVLNVAGPRESKSLGIHAAARAFLRAVLAVV